MSCMAIYDMPVDDLVAALAKRIDNLEGVTANSGTLKFRDIPPHYSKAEYVSPEGLLTKEDSLFWMPDITRMNNKSGWIKGVKKSRIGFTVGRSETNPTRSFLALDRGWRWVSRARIPLTDILLFYNDTKDSLEILDSDVSFLFALKGSRSAVVIKGLPVSFANEVDILTDPKVPIPDSAVLEATDVLKRTQPKN